MNEEELKAGERYNFTLLYTGQSINNKFRFESPTGIHYILGLGDMEAVSPVSAPENGTKNTAPSPKYDPCRLFKKGDRVRVVECKGRIKPYLENVLGKVYTLDEGEDYKQIACIKADDIDLIDVCHLELIHPVEEQGPYIVTSDEVGHFVCDADGLIIALYYNNLHPNAKKAAEAERDRLNAEHRKERK